MCFQVLAHLSQNAAAALWLLFVNASSSICPLLRILYLLYPCVIVLKIVSLSFFVLFIVKEFVDLVFPSFSWSSDRSVSSDACFKSGIPFCTFP